MGNLAEAMLRQAAEALVDLKEADVADSIADKETRLDDMQLEIDKEALNVDVLSSYPLEFYHAAERFASPKEIEDIMDTVGGRLGSPGQYQGFGFTHDTSDINDRPHISVYKTMKSMMEKLDAEFKLVNRLRGVDVRDMAKRVIESHFLPDIIGNMNSFSTIGAFGLSVYTTVGSR